MTPATVPLAQRLRGIAAPLPDPATAPYEISAGGEPPSAVLVLADPGADGTPLLFIRRSLLVSTHRGQIAFPGGGVEPGDGGPAGTALREASEEVGVDPARVEVLGLLPPMHTATSGRRLDPVLALSTGQQALRTDHFEVAELFWIPLEQLLAVPITRRQVPGAPEGTVVTFIEVGGRVIWGATGAIVADLLEQIRE